MIEAPEAAPPSDFFTVPFTSNICGVSSEILSGWQEYSIKQAIAKANMRILLFVENVIIFLSFELKIPLLEV
jgi:hypothetical protein